MYMHGIGVCVCVRESEREKGGERERGREGEKECDRWDLGKVLVYSASMDVNSCFSASMSADLHNGVGTLNTETPIYSFAISAGKAHPHPDFICLIQKLGTCLPHTHYTIIPSRFARGTFCEHLRVACTKVVAAELMNVSGL